jgi:hypothetical protein
MPDRYIEMTWACSACAERNLGRHVACQRCGKAKTTEEYEMPADVEQAASVQDAELLRMAAAGANWVCRYCGSDQRRFDGECARCGGERSAGERGGPPPRPVAARNHPAPRGARSGLPTVGLAVAGFLLISMLFAGCLVGLFSMRSTSDNPGAYRTPVAVTVSERHEPTGPVPGKLVAMHWEQRVDTERYQLLPGEGFADDRPAEAIGVRPAGTHVHHVDQVPDGFREETYTEQVDDGYREESYTETVSDGTRSESYTVRESCGQDCRDNPKSCRQKCTSGKNGFAKCSDVCTGGGRTCSTRYCTRTRTRQVPKTKTVTRTRKIPKTKTVTRTRQVPKTRPVERMAPWFTWKAWGWKHDRVARLEGDAPPLAWPAPEALDAGTRLGKGERERESRAGTYSLTVEDSSGKQYPYQPQDGALLSSLQVGAPVTIVLAPGGRVESVTAP